MDGREKRIKEELKVKKSIKTRKVSIVRLIHASCRVKNDVLPVARYRYALT
jgi:hypothetical protein